jgi:polar amino acid transport system substrate-binding protein
MRRVLVTLTAFGVLAAACGGNGGAGTTTGGSTTGGATTTGAATSGGPTTSGGGGTAADCAAQATLKTTGTLTIGTDNPVFQPWFGGAKGSGQGDWKADPNNGTGNPYSGQGYEDEVAYDLADQLGFPKDKVTWVAVPFNNSYKPGDKPFDFYIGQVSYSTDRAQAVDLSDGYYNVQQALVANKGTPITKAKSFADLKGFQLGAQLGTTSYQYIVDNIKPDKQPKVYDNSNDVIAALNAQQVDGYLVDAPTAYVNVLIGEAKHGVVVGQFPTIGAQEHFSLVLQKGSSLTPCANQAIAALKSAGTLDALQQKYLKDITYPVIQAS